jgi:hypothetical protein
VHKGAVVWQDIQQRQQGGEGVLQRFIQGEDLPRDLGPDNARVIAVVHMTVALQ